MQSDEGGDTGPRRPARVPWRGRLEAQDLQPRAPGNSRWLRGAPGGGAPPEQAGKECAKGLRRSRFRTGGVAIGEGQIREFLRGL